MMLFILYVIIVIPFKISFIEETYPGWDIFDYVMDGFFFVDIILTFFSAYTDDNDAIITDHCKIAKRYLKFLFWIDLVSIIPFEFSGGQSYNIMLRITKINKMYKILKITKLVRGIKHLKGGKNDYGSTYEF